MEVAHRCAAEGFGSKHHVGEVMRFYLEKATRTRFKGFRMARPKSRGVRRPRGCRLCKF